MGEPARSLVTFHLRGWTRSRGPLLWLLFLGVWGWFNWETFQGATDAPWWAGWGALPAWLGFLAGYDTYARMREEGTLRSVLLNPVRRRAIAASFWAGSVALVALSLLLFLGFVVGVRPVPLNLATMGGVALGLLTGAAFVAYAQLASLVLPRDTAAVLGLLVVIIGSAPHDQWIPPTAPAWVEPAAQGLFLVLPTTHRLNDALAGGSGGTALLVLLGQILLPLTVIGVLLGRNTLTRRPKR